MAESFSYSEQKGIFQMKSEEYYPPKCLIYNLIDLLKGFFMQQRCHILLGLNNGLQSLGSYLPYQGVRLFHFNGKMCVCLYMCGVTTKVVNLSYIAFVISDLRS